MRKYRALLVAIAFLSPFGNAFACSIIYPPPDERFKESTVVVLAVPKAISYLPKEAEKRGYEGPFRQTVLWQVLASWKGKYRAGNQFTTRQNFSMEYACSTRFPTFPHDVQLLYLRGKEPYVDFYSFGPSYSVEDFKYLESVNSK
jgi:hypothetical protein